MGSCKPQRLRRVNISIPRDTSAIGRAAGRPGRLVSSRSDRPSHQLSDSLLANLKRQRLPTVPYATLIFFVDPLMSLKQTGSVSSVAAFRIPRVKYTSLPSLEVGFLKYTPMKTDAP